MPLLHMIRTLYGPTIVSEITPIVTPAMLFGVALDLLLFGVLTAQVYIYYLSFPIDRILLKVAVICVYLAGVAQTGLALVDLYSAFLAWAMGRRPWGDSGDWEIMMLDSDHLWISITALTSVVAIVIQSLYAHRIYLISQKLWLAIVIICMSFCQFASGIFGAFCYSGEVAISVLGSRGSYFETSVCNAGFTWIWGPVNVSCDLIITICMVTFLLKQRTRTISRQTRTHITRIVRIVIETGMVSTVLMIIYTVLFSLWNLDSFPEGLFFPLPGLMMSKVYSNSMLVLLNNRMTVANGRNALESLEFVELSRLRVLEGDSQLRRRGGSTSAEVVQNDDGS